MAARNFTVRQDQNGIYHFQGEVSIHDLDEFKGFLQESLKSGHEIAISLAKVRFIDTAALQLLIAFRRRLEPDIRLRICSVSAEVEAILSLCGLGTALA